LIGLARIVPIIVRMLDYVAFAELILCWIVWSLAFVQPHKRAAKEERVERAPASRWGIGLVAVSYALAWVYVRPVGFEKARASLIVSMVLAPLGTWLAWAAVRHLGKQWRYEAALSADHELIQSGPYARVRHPIYTSLFLMLLATGACRTWWPLFVAAVVTFIVGTEIRVRAEERLLEERFGEAFAGYRRRVPAYIPFLR
jgi:protein-S-isoprenylcysteine O-methyltransferase Ste14